MPALPCCLDRLPCPNLSAALSQVLPPTCPLPDHPRRVTDLMATICGTSLHHSRLRASNLPCHLSAGSLRTRLRILPRASPELPRTALRSSLAAAFRALSFPLARLHPRVYLYPWLDHQRHTLSMRRPPQIPSSVLCPIDAPFLLPFPRLHKNQRHTLPTSESRPLHMSCTRFLRQVVLDRRWPHPHLLHLHHFSRLCDMPSVNRKFPRCKRQIPPALLSRAKPRPCPLCGRLARLLWMRLGASIPTQSAAVHVPHRSFSTKPSCHFPCLYRHCVRCRLRRTISTHLPLEIPSCITQQILQALRAIFRIALTYPLQHHPR
jgi:hypothetical protein